MFEKPNQMAGVLEFVDIRPYLGLPTGFVRGGFTASCAASVQRYRSTLNRYRSSRHFDKNAADFLDLLIGARMCS